MRKLATLVVVLVLAASCNGDDGVETTASGGGSSGGTSGPTSTVVDEVVVLSEDNGEVGCAIAEVGIGGPNATTLNAIGDCGEPIPSWEALAKNGRISTDNDGEAQIRIDKDEMCGLLYVFRDSDLVVSSCPEQSSGSACVQQGSIAFSNSCSGVLTVQTPSATVKLVGTWVAVSYIPETDLTLASTFEGSVEVTPRDAPDVPTFVEEGSFYYTTGGNEISDIVGIPSREAIDVAALPDFIAATQLEADYVGVFDRAIIDGVLPPPLFGFDYVNIRGGGELFEDEALANAFVTAIDWQTQVPELDLGNSGSIQALLGAEPGISLLEISYDLDRSLATFEEAGFDGRSVVILYETAEADAVGALLTSGGGLEPMAGVFSFELVEAESSLEARQLYADLIAEGLDVFWISSS